MKKIRGMISFCIIIVLVSTGIILSINISNINELILGALLGSVISIIITIFIEYINFTSQQRIYRDEYFWEQVNPYRESLDKLFFCAKDLFQIDWIFEGIPHDEGDWIIYKDVYLSYKEILDELLDSYVNLVISIVNKNMNIIFNLSVTLSKIEKKNIFGKRSEYHRRASKLYQIIENIDWSLEEAYGHLLNI